MEKKDIRKHTNILRTFMHHLFEKVYTKMMLAIVIMLFVVFNTKTYLPVTGINEKVFVGIFLLIIFGYFFFLKKLSMFIRILGAFILAPTLILLLLSGYLFNDSFHLIFQKYRNQEQALKNCTAQALFNYAMGNFETAAALFEKVIRISPLVKSHYLWLGECYSRNNDFEKAYKAITRYYENEGSEIRNQDLQFLTYVKLVSLLNSENIDAFTESFDIMPESFEMLLGDEFRLLLYVYDSTDSDINDILVTSNFNFDTISALRNQQYGCWSQICLQLMRRNMPLHELMGLMFLQKSNPCRFYEDFYTVGGGIFNLTFVPLPYRLQMQNLFRQNLQAITPNESILYMKYQNALIHYGLEIGSSYALKCYLIEISTRYDDIHSKISEILERETSIAFSPAYVSDTLCYILWVTAKSYGEMYPPIHSPVEMEAFAGEYRFRLLRVTADKMYVSEIHPFGPECLGGDTHMVLTANFGKEQNNFLVVIKQGTSHTVSLSLVQIGKSGELIIKPIVLDGQYNYHVYDIFLTPKDQTMELSMCFELRDWNIANAARKVFGIVRMTVNEDATVIVDQVFYPNPALEFFNTLEKDIEGWKAYLIDELKIHDLIIDDAEFREFIEGKQKPRFIRTRIDDTYSQSWGSFSPSYSALMFGYIDEDIDRKGKPSRDIKYMLIVERDTTSVIRLLDLYKISDGKVKESITRNP